MMEGQDEGEEEIHEIFNSDFASFIAAGSTLSNWIINKYYLCQMAVEIPATSYILTLISLVLLLLKIKIIYLIHPLQDVGSFHFGIGAKHYKSDVFSFAIGNSESFRWFCTKNLLNQTLVAHKVKCSVYVSRDWQHSQRWSCLVYSNFMNFKM